LKLLDSFLQPASSFRGVDDDNFRDLTGFLVSEFFSQAENVQHTVRQATGMTSSDQNYTTDVLGVGGAAQQAADGALDVRLPGVCAALILLSTSLSSILLSERETRANESGVGADPNLVMVTPTCHDATASSANSAGTGFIECLIGMVVSYVPRMKSRTRTMQVHMCLLLETLRLLNISLPPINHGQARSSFPGDRAAVPDRPMMTGFPYLKRDLVRLLGILCHDSKPIQDRVRCCGGIPIVLNLCVIDERNPCKSYFFFPFFDT
jgi:ataxin-10